MKTVLIADDDVVMLKLLSYHLVKAGYAVIRCHDGLGVMEKLEDGRPDLAIFDLMLPGKSGLELIHEFKAAPVLALIPLLVVTGQGRGSTRNELMEAGADQVFTKPFSPTALVSRIRELLE